MTLLFVTPRNAPVDEHLYGFKNDGERSGFQFWQDLQSDGYESSTCAHRHDVTVTSSIASSLANTGYHHFSLETILAPQDKQTVGLQPNGNKSLSGQRPYLLKCDCVKRSSDKFLLVKSVSRKKMISLFRVVHTFKVLNQSQLLHASRNNMDDKKKDMCSLCLLLRLKEILKSARTRTPDRDLNHQPTCHRPTRLDELDIQSACPPMRASSFKHYKPESTKRTLHFTHERDEYLSVNSKLAGDAVHGVGVEFIRILPETHTPQLTNLFCECAPNDDVFKTPRCQPAIELYCPSGRRLLVLVVTTFADRRCSVVNTMNPSANNPSFLDQSF
uniref:Uncharacterized protein n=1 Tax=Timema monikensis TaxID=170555 RepID=A0A7R9E5V4_9NEOP|nr:unnamed protein product [Timema monikensis]